MTIVLSAVSGFPGTAFLILFSCIAPLRHYSILITAHPVFPLPFALFYYCCPPLPLLYYDKKYLYSVKKLLKNFKKDLTNLSSNAIIISVVKTSYLRVCWNWQTGTFEGRVFYDVRVQVPSLADKKKAVEINSAAFLFY